MTMPSSPVFIALTQVGAALAQKLAADLPGAEVHGLFGRTEKVDLYFTSTTQHVRELFRSGHTLVGICATGILIRILGPVISDKRNDPAVLALAEDGTAVVPLLGGHGGANTLAQILAKKTGGYAAITTASDLVFGLALDDPPLGWKIAEPNRVKGVTSALLAEEPVSLAVEAADAQWLTDTDLSFSESETGILITDQAPMESDQRLIYHPPVLVIGIGCERGAESGEVLELVTKTLNGANLASSSVSCVVSIDLKANEDAVHAVADYFDVPARFFF